MKILVAVKRVIDYNAKIRVKPDTTNVDLSNTKMAINPFCEIAIEAAVRLKESGTAQEVVAVSIGPKSCQEQLRSALALGADRGIHIETNQSLESLHVAKVLLKISQEEQPDLIILGKQAIDTDNNQTGQMLASLLDIPQATFACELTIDNNKALVTREIDGGLQTLALHLPAVVTTDLRLNEPRYVSLPNIMKAKRKPLSIRPIEQLVENITQHTKLLRVEEPALRKQGILLSNTEELIEKIKSEIQLIGTSG